MTTDQMLKEIDRLRGVLLHIQHMDVYTRPGETEPHMVMKDIAEKALSTQVRS